MTYLALLLAYLCWCALFGLFFYLADIVQDNSAAPDYDNTN